MCQVNHARCVKPIMPLARQVNVGFYPIMLYIVCICGLSGRLLLRCWLRCNMKLGHNYNDIVAIISYHLQPWPKQTNPSQSTGVCSDTACCTPGRIRSPTRASSTTSSSIRTTCCRSSTRCCAGFVWKISLSPVLPAPSASLGKRSIRLSKRSSGQGWRGCCQKNVVLAPPTSCLRPSCSSCCSNEPPTRTSHPTCWRSACFGVSVSACTPAVSDAHWPEQEKKTGSWSGAIVAADHPSPRHPGLRHPARASARWRQRQRQSYRAAAARVHRPGDARMDGSICLAAGCIAPAFESASTSTAKVVRTVSWRPRQRTRIHDAQSQHNADRWKMNHPSQQKVTAHHLSRKAFLYVRQSTVRQVFENNESTKRQ